MTAVASTPGRSSPMYGEGRQALLAAAVRVVAAQGLRHLTYRGVAREANVTHGLVAHHFGSRDALLEAALQYSVENSVTSISTRPGTGDLDAIFAGLIGMVVVNPDEQAFQYELILESRRSPELRPHVESLYGTYRQALREELAHGGIDCDEAMAQLFIAAADGLIFQQITLDRPELNEAALAHLRRFLRTLVE
ncbi:TetR/AcrR family transcriptional regulator [Rhodococcus sp. ACS1]|uniref:DNA-binding transcriptional regulator YbjK n=1 Tax=Rhodococcus koreensis TaxID=99653 RepID=A0A1H4TBC3_9NOCA|nr:MULTISPECIES: TetR family transcriptional regulator [Rhodococcus]PBC46242.1 TetR/AcrR family transcriptional regulator [Rhodococcus sp. ACS1]SEC53619.1 DNA-binding transcriptional regulator YbjK [Rhodococcus koreensis]